MTESEWLACDDPKRLLTFLMRRGQAPAGSYGGIISERKLRFFVAQTMLYVSGRGNPPASAAVLDAVERLEQFADDHDEDGLVEAWTAAHLPRPDIAMATVAGGRIHAQICVEYPMPDVKRFQCALLRDLIGNPFRPVPRCTWCAGDGLASHEDDERKCVLCSGTGRMPLDRKLLTPTVTAFARTVYDDRDFVLLPILADTLEEAGCTDAAILDHLRGPGPHVRGCWALGVILGRE